MKKSLIRLVVGVVLIISNSSLLAQDPLRFEKAVKEIVARDANASTKKLIIFTGSSSIIMWKDLNSDIPGNVLNHGFGGSEMSDLVYFTEPLIIRNKPSKVFIYEGDNDISAGRSNEQILSNADKILTMIRKELSPKVKVYFISPKPSVARWHLKAKYEEYNKQLKEWVATKKNVTYVDVWTPMLDAEGEVQKDLFLKDNLHMNRKGYDIWKKVIQPYTE